MDTQLRRYIKREFYKGKSLPARLLDSFFFKIMAFLGLFILFFILKTGVVRAIIGAAAITSSAGILKFVYMRTRLSVFSGRRLEKAKKDCMLERLVLLDKKHRRTLYKKILVLASGSGEDGLTPSQGGYIAGDRFMFAFQNHPKYAVNVEQVCDICRKMRELSLKEMLLVSAGGFDADARAMAIRRSDKCELIEQKELTELLKNTFLYPSDEEATEYLKGEIEEQKLTGKRLREAFLDADKGKAFALLAIVLAVWPLFSGFSIVYPIASAICAALAAYGFFRSYKKNKSPDR